MPRNAFISENRQSEYLLKILMNDYVAFAQNKGFKHMHITYVLYSIT